MPSDADSRFLVAFGLLADWFADLQGRRRHRRTSCSVAGGEPPAGSRAPTIEVNFSNPIDAPCASTIEVNFSNPIDAPPQFSGGAYGVFSGKMNSEQWITFEVQHGGGIHQLDMHFTTGGARPMRVRVDGTMVAEAVGAGTTGTYGTEGLHWFCDEAQIPLGAAGKSRVSFQAHNYLPHIAGFRLVPCGKACGSETSQACKSETSEDDPTAYTPLLKKGDHKMWNTFAFDIGTCDLHGKDESAAEAINLSLAGQEVSFKSGDIHDAIYLNGIRFGRRSGIMKECAILTEGARIDSLTIGISAYGGRDAGANLCGSFTDFKVLQDNGKIVTVVVTAKLRRDIPTWKYDRSALGLNLWITSIFKSSCVYRYGFTLSSTADLEFNAAEFSKFWEWLVSIKYFLYNYDYAGRDNGQITLRSGQEEMSKDTLAKRMEPLRMHLVESFGGSAVIPRSMGALHGSDSYIHISYDVFSIWIARAPNGEDLMTQLFVRGVQYDIQGCSFNGLASNVSVDACREEMLALALASSLQDAELLFNMGLVNDTFEYMPRGGVREIVPLRKEVPMYPGSYEPDEQAKRIVEFLALIGLRKISYDTVFDLDNTPGWDIYNVAAGMPGGIHKIGIGATLCFLVQTVAPLILIFNSMELAVHDLEVQGSLTALRVMFGLYALLYEYKEFEGISDYNKLSMWLCALPEINSNTIVLGVLANCAAKVLVSISMVILLMSSDSALAIVLNAIALYFILSIDDDVVSARHVNHLKKKQRKRLFSLHSQGVLAFKRANFQNFEGTIESSPINRLWMITHLRRCLGVLNLVILAIGVVYFVFVAAAATAMDL